MDERLYYDKVDGKGYFYYSWPLDCLENLRKTLTMFGFFLNILPKKSNTMATPYTDTYNSAQIRPERKKEIQIAVDRIKAGQSRYEGVAATLGNGIPWWFIGICHYMEAGMFGVKNFNYHLHCGDLLTGRTFHVPKGRPKFNPGNGTNPPSATNPYTWEESALDALRFSGYDKITDWSIENCLILFEKYNGLGYKKKGVPSPYLWSYTTAYVKGKYVDDGKYDTNAVSHQPGTAAIMKLLL